MPDEVLQALNPERGGIYVDGTLGGGGHSKLILDKLPQGDGNKLIGIDRDENAIAAATRHIAPSHPASSAIFVRDNFHNMPQILQDLNIPAVNGVLLDLGVSSHQLDTPERGFSYRFDGPLDMRMDKSKNLSAFDIVNTYDEKEIADILFNFGEERNSRRIAREICNAREISTIKTTFELSAVIERTSPPYFGKGLHPSTRSFMALRIAVNNELAPLEGVIRDIVPFLSKGGRIAVITFHSLEDRIVKKTFASLADPCDCPHDIPYCVCGKKPSLKVISRKPVLPGTEEIENNRRASSAKLRVAERMVLHD